MSCTVNAGDARAVRGDRRLRVRGGTDGRTGRRGADLQQGGRADPLQELHQLPSAGRDRTDVAAHLQGRASVGEVDRRAGRQRHDAAVACRSGARRVPQRSPAERQGQGDAVAWANGGAPEGNPPICRQRRPTTAAGLSARPMQIFAMNEDYPIPATGEIPYQFLEIDTKLTEDKWVQAFEVKAGDPKAVHHVILYARPPATPAGRPSAPPPAAAGAQAAARPAQPPLFDFAPNMDIPAGQFGGPPLPPEQRKPAFPTSADPFGSDRPSAASCPASSSASIRRAPR